MKCPKCDAEIDKFADVCPYCKIDIFKYKSDSKEDIEFTKTAFIKVINILQIIGFIIMAIIAWNNEETLQGFIYLVIGLVIFAFIKGFSDIIDLLDSINDKLGK